jgi:hypothetical protein
MPFDNEETGKNIDPGFRDKPNAIRFAALSLVCLPAIVILVLLLWHFDKLIAFGLTGQIYYVALMFLAIFPSVVLFEVLKSVGAYRGKQFGGVFVLVQPEME